MKRRFLIRFTALMTALALTLGLCSCGGGSKNPIPELNMDMSARENVYTFSASPSDPLTLSEDGAAAVLAAVDAQKADYTLEYLYEMDEVKARLDFDASVTEHAHSALDATGALNAQHLTRLVLANNAEFLADDPFGYSELTAEDITELCTLIIHTVERMKAKYPDIDWERVYCNLGNMKILYDVGMLAYAQVSGDMVLSVSENNAGIVTIMEGENGFRDVLIHETMHIIQVGCECEQIENCGRRAGISVYWDDFLLNSTDWTWMVEGSAERNMCTLTGGDAISYQYKMDYLCSFTMSVLLRDEVKADTMETLCFYSDPDLLFDAFGCESEAERDEVIRMMITMNVLQTQPESFFLAYKEATGVDLRESEETLNEFCYSLKPAVCITLAKEFYENLSAFLKEESLPANDLFFLLTVFEGHLNQHLRYGDESKKEINAPFISAYTAMRDALFSALEAENAGLDLDAMYGDYTVSESEGTLNAELAMLPEEKRDFLAERAEWQASLNALGVKVE